MLPINLNFPNQIKFRHQYSWSWALKISQSIWRRGFMTASNHEAKKMLFMKIEVTDSYKSMAVIFQYLWGRGGVCVCGNVKKKILVKSSYRPCLLINKCILLERKIGSGEGDIVLSYPLISHFIITKSQGSSFSSSSSFIKQ